jgi:hypothetical protein
MLGSPCTETQLPANLAAGLTSRRNFRQTPGPNCVQIYCKWSDCESPPRVNPLLPIAEHNLRQIGEADVEPTRTGRRSGCLWRTIQAADYGSLINNGARKNKANNRTTITSCHFEFIVKPYFQQIESALSHFFDEAGRNIDQLRPVPI